MLVIIWGFFFLGGGGGLGSHDIYMCGVGVLTLSNRRCSLPADKWHMRRVCQAVLEALSSLKRTTLNGDTF